MSHDTNHEHSGKKETIISFRNSFWLVIIIVGLFIAALNFVNAESGKEGEEKKEAKGIPTTETKALETKEEAKTQDTTNKGPMVSNPR